MDSYGDWLSGVAISLQIRIKFRACEEPILGTALHPVAVRSCSFHPCECVISVFFGSREISVHRCSACLRVDWALLVSESERLLAGFCWSRDGTEVFLGIRFTWQRSIICLNAGAVVLDCLHVLHLTYLLVSDAHCLHLPNMNYWV